MQQAIFLKIYLSNIVVHCMVRFYGNIVQLDLGNVVHNRIHRLGIYSRYLIIHIAGWYAHY